MTAAAAAALRVVVPARLRPRGARFLFERNLMVYRRTWMIIFSGFFEPLLYLFSLGFGLDDFVGTVKGPGGVRVGYASYIAPALLAASAMNGPVYDTGNIFFKLRYQRVYDAVLSTPVRARDVAVGETAWALFRGLIYAMGFLVVIAALGLVHSPWAILALPAVFLIGFSFAGAGVAAATYMRTWQDFDLIQLVQLPLFLFSATFYPLSVYPDWLQIVVQLTPLYHAIGLLRALSLGTVGWWQLVDLGYLLALGLVGIRLSAARIERLLLR
jgi:lipooligosaccharide transport system permease protein